MTDTIQSRIREYLAGDNDEDHRKLLREAADMLGHGDATAMEGWHAALDAASELVVNAPDDRYRNRAEQVRRWVRVNRPELPNPPETFTVPSGYVHVGAGIYTCPPEAWPKR